MRSALLLAVAVLALALPTSGSAAPPVNDDFANAASVESLPFADSTNLDGAGVELGEQHFCNFKTRSVWYRIDPALVGPVTIDLTGSSPGVVGTLYRHFGGGVGNLAAEGCIFGGSTAFSLQPGTYYVQVSDSGFAPASVELGIETIPPPPNDAFGAARSIDALPYSDVVQMLSSTVEAEEPLPGAPSFLGTAWWRLVAAESGPLLVGEANCCGRVHVYTGDALGSLQEVDGTRSFGRLIFSAEAGTTYLLQVGHSGSVCCGGLLGLSIGPAPSLSTAIMHSPFDPTAFDTIQLSAFVFDPAAFPVESVTWDFGDGGVGEGHSASHRYFADGDYVVTATARTIDGRTGISTRTISVRTHDVAITRFQVPQAALVGKTKSIVVDVLASRYDEVVTVRLERSVPGGFEHVGTLTQLVRARKQGVAFAFSYSFRPEDALTGKVTFRAIATIASGRDALPADNEAISFATKVG